MKRLLLWLKSLSFALILSTSAHAIPLQDLFGGGSITVGDKHFDRWQLVSSSASAPTLLPDLSLIDVTGLSDGGNDPGPGLHFDAGGQLTVATDSALAFIDLSFGFRVSTLGNLSIKGNSLEIVQGSVTLDGDNGSTINEFIGTAAGLSDLGTMGVELSFLAGGGGLTQVLADSAAFDPQQEIFVTKTIRVHADGTDLSASLFAFDQRFSQEQVSEPAVTALFALGLVGLRIARRRRPSTLAT